MTIPNGNLISQALEEIFIQSKTMLLFAVYSKDERVDILGGMVQNQNGYCGAHHGAVCIPTVVHTLVQLTRWGSDFVPMCYVQLYIFAGYVASILLEPFLPYLT
jgi:hypothetical protein